jgi:hypothetical protein
MLQLIIALLLSFGVISSAEEINEQIIQENQDLIELHIIDDDREID